MFKFLNNITYTVVNTISVAFTGFLGTLFLNDGMSYDFLVACLLVRPPISKWGVAGP